VLADNLGLIKGNWQIGKPMEQEAKGIYGEVALYLPDGSSVSVEGWSLRGQLYGEQRRWYAPETQKSLSWKALAERDPENVAIRWFKTEFELGEGAISPGQPILVRTAPLL